MTRNFLNGVTFYASLLVSLLVLPPAQGADYRVADSPGLKVLSNNAERLSWSRALNVIAYDSQNAKGYYDVWSMNPDGSNNKCLTCSTTVLPPLNKGNPCWTPDGKFIAFEVQQNPSLGAVGDAEDRPGSGWNNDVWIMDAAGQNFYRITNVPAVTGGVIYPRFNWEGNKLVWGQRLDPNPAPYGTWELAIGTFSVSSSGVPSVTNIQYYTPGAQKLYYEPHGFSLDDTTLFFMGDLQAGTSQFGMDIYSFNLETQVLTDLTNTPNQWEEFPRPMPTTPNTLMYMSTAGTAWTDTHFECDLWTMNYDGTNKVQLTFFNDPNSPTYVPAGICLADPDWNEAQNMIAIYGNAGTGPAATGQMWLEPIEPANSVVVAADYDTPPVAADSIASIFGTGLATQTTIWSSGGIPTNLGGTSVTIKDSNGSVTAASLYFVGHEATFDQINIAVPPGVAPGPAEFTVTSPSGTQTRSTVNMGAVAPGLYTVNQTGAGVAAAYVVRAGQTGYQLIYTCTAGAGTCTPVPINVTTGAATLSLFGTGFRNRSSLSNVVVTVGSQTVAAQYAGVQGGYPGFDQLNIPLPASLAGSGLVNIVVEVDGVYANPVQIQIQ
jgi:uncharacterized protein (TIGR03437 family)